MNDRQNASFCMKNVSFFRNIKATLSDLLPIVCLRASSCCGWRAKRACGSEAAPLGKIFSVTGEINA